MISLKFLLVLSNAFWLCKAEDELVAVTTLMRHGARIPNNFYPTDPYSKVKWPFVLGDLTNEGIAEMHDVGKWLRRKYSDFLSKKYDPKEMYAQALDYDRCIRSGEACLAGLYPPTSAENWNPQLRWRPTPIHISPAHQDIVVNMNACPKIPKESALIRKTETYRQIMAVYGDTFKYIGEKSGHPIDFASMYPLFDTLLFERRLNLTLPDWAQKVWPHLTPLAIQYSKMDSMTTTERRIQSGPMLGRIQNQFDRAITGVDFGTTKTIYRKYMVYFATEWMLLNLTYTLGLPSIGIPDFGALYIFELWKNEMGTHYVKIYFRHSGLKGTKAKRVAVEGEKAKLKYEKFKQIIAPYLVDSVEWVALCESFTHKNVTVDTDVPMS
ncbi:testicular acid phosphatase homolog [Harmonia axyridis]|uniref:testicular acid phosphatase homolog n=1 Tax=Harmonia axyridis TaxID=115357 RepID=UPI001E278D6A|nr:testicular acid phosphatase homolog [Harmonia axyridis]